MNSLMKRLNGILLVLVLIASALPVSVSAAGTGYKKASDVEYYVSSGYTANWGYRGEDCLFLSPYASDFYDSTSFDTLSQLDGGSNANNAHDSALYDALQNLMADAHDYKTSYDATKSLYKYTDCQMNDTSKISSFYSGLIMNSSWGSGWNREHTWPDSKGLGGQDENDIMMLRPTSTSENSSRGNKSYGVSSGYYDPNDQTAPASVRGDVARITLYVYVRWGNTNIWGHYKENNVWKGNFESLDVLLDWMEEDPVDTWEMGRNDAVQSITGTRNVFVDYPEYAWLLFGQEVPEDIVTPSGEASSAVNPCIHGWNDATCTEPATCSKCGKTQGVANGHNDTDGDNICNICGTAVGCIHQWKTEYDSNNHYQKCTLCSETKNSAAHTLVNNQCACGYVYTPSTGNTFVKVTTAPTDWSGEYLIVYEGGSLAFDGSLTKLDNNRNTIPVVISNGKITLDDEYSDCYFTITSKSSGYTIQSSSGYYIGQTSNANGLETNTATSYANEISFNGDGSFVAKSGGAFLRFNAASDQMRFRYYKSSTYTGQKAITLYKREVHKHDYKSNVTQPTCTQGGYTTYTCICGAVYTDNKTVALGHNYTSEETKAATCTEAGVMTYTCGNCGDTYTDDVVTALPHTNEYTDNLDGTHKYACSVCGAVETASEDHVYDNAQDTDCNACGAVREVGPIFDANLNFSNLTMNMQSSLKLSFQIDAADIVGVADYYAILHKADGFLEKDVTVRINKDQMVNTYFAEFPMIVACDMVEKIEATLYVVDTDGTVRYGKTISYSILDYLNLMMGVYEGYAKDPSSAYYDTARKWMQLAVETLNYGAVAQAEFGHKTDMLANANLTDDQKAFALTEDPKPEYRCNFGADNKSKEIVYSSLTLNLKERVYGMLLIDTANLKSADKEALYAEVRDPETGALVQKITFAQMEVGGGSYYWIPISEIAPAFMTKIYTVQVFAGETALSTQAEYSIDSYAALAGDTSAATVAALRYGAAAANALA